MAAGPSPSDLARAVFAAIERRDVAALEELIHPDAVLEMAMARGEVVRGRRRVLAALRQAWKRVHALSISELHELSGDAVIIVGRSRHPLPGGGHADMGVVWLCEYREGMLWRQRLAATVEEARTIWAGGKPGEPA